MPVDWPVETKHVRRSDPNRQRHRRLVPYGGAAGFRGGTRGPGVSGKRRPVRTRNEIAWTPWLRTLAGIRGDSYRFNVEASDPRNSGTRWAGIVSPKGGAVFGPWKGTEDYT